MTTPTRKPAVKTAIKPIESRVDRDTPELMKSQTVVFEGQAYHTDPVAMSSLEFLEALRDNDMITAIEYAITPKGYQQLKAQIKDPATGFSPLSRFQEFMSELFSDEEDTPTDAS